MPTANYKLPIGKYTGTFGSKDHLEVGSNYEVSEIDGSVVNLAFLSKVTIVI